MLCRARPHARVSMLRGAPRQQRGCARAHTGGAHFCTDSRRMCSRLIQCVTTLAIVLHVVDRGSARFAQTVRCSPVDQALMGMDKI